MTLKQIRIRFWQLYWKLFTLPGVLRREAQRYAKHVSELEVEMNRLRPGVPIVWKSHWMCKWVDSARQYDGLIYPQGGGMTDDNAWCVLDEEVKP